MKLRKPFVRNLISIVLLGLLCLHAQPAASHNTKNIYSTKSLHIDQLLSSTFLGGTGMDGMQYVPHIDMAADAEGNIYVVGITSSTDFPTTPGAYQSTLTGYYDIFIAKFDSDLKTLFASTLLGGDASEGMPRICLGRDDHIYIIGTTGSTNFPTTPGAIDSDLSGDEDFFVAKLNSDLTTLHASTFLGGDGTEEFPALTMDHNGNLFVGGLTTHGSFPTTVGAFDEGYNGGNSDLFVTKFDAELSAILASTFVGGTYQDEKSVRIAANGSGEVYLLGTTGSFDFPTTPGAYDTSFNGPHEYDRSNLDICVSKLSNDLTTLLASTFIGGSDFDRAYFMTLDNNGNVLLSGHMSSTDYPTTPGVLDDHHNGFQETFVSRLDGDLSNLLTSTYLTPDDIGFGYVNAIGCNEGGDVWLFGVTDQIGYPVTEDAFDDLYNGGQLDATLMKLSGDFTEILYATFLGGNGRDLDNAMALSGGEVYLAGYTASANFPVTDDGYDPDYNGGGSDCYVARFTLDRFSRITAGDPVTDGGYSNGVVWVDYDNDDFLDLFVTNWYDAGQRNCLYHNNGDGTFTKVTDGIIVNEIGSLGSTWGDYDNDGDVDAFVVNPGFGSAGATNYFYLNDGDGTFTKVTEGIIANDVATWTSAACGDYDNNGWLDLFAGNHCPPSVCQGVYVGLYRNDGGAFDKTVNGEIGLVEEEGRGAWSDFDGDGDLDLCITRPQLETNTLCRNNGDGTFTEITTGVILSDSSVACSWGDYDNDGDLDLFIPGIRGTSHSLYNNTGNGEFIKVTGQELVDENGWHGKGSSWGDYDNDGDLDLIVTSNYINAPQFNALYENDNNGIFTRVTEGPIATDYEASSGAAWGDYDRDGDLDLFIANVNDENNTLYRNNGSGNNWINVKCAGTMSNRSAVGAKVRVKATIRGIGVWQLREISGQTGMAAQNSLNAHFGLGDATVIDSVRIEWPSGIVSLLKDVDVNQFLTVTEVIPGDADGDGITDEDDNCPNFYNPDQSPVERGDINCEGGVDVLDVLLVVNHILGITPLTGEPLERADCNIDGEINIIDVLGIVNTILGSSSCEP